MTTDAKEIVRRVSEEPWTGDYSSIDELVSDDYVGYDPATPEPTRGRQGLKDFVETLRTAYPDAQLTIEQQIAEGEWIASRWSARGTHQGELMGIPATGKQVTVTGISLARVTNGKLVEEWSSWDTLGMLQQLGAVPAGETAATTTTTT